jgi:hypothetical protein
MVAFRSVTTARYAQFLIFVQSSSTQQYLIAVVAPTATRNTKEAINNKRIRKIFLLIVASVGHHRCHRRRASITKLHLSAFAIFVATTTNRTNQFDRVKEAVSRLHLKD